jgi:protein involved in polysaccharide export with SLBB domain
MQPARLGAAVFCLSVHALFCTLALAPSSSAQTVETSEQTNERIRALAAASHAPAPTDYVIGSGDLISVQVFDVPELSRDLRVGQTGTIGIPLIPVRLHVSGLTEIQAERKIEEVLEADGLVSHAEVSIIVREKKSRPITVVGAVGHPMVYSADRQVTLIEVLAEAGGIASDAGDSVIITRPERDASTDPAVPPAISPEDAAPTPGQEAIPPVNTPSADSAADSLAQKAPIFPSPAPVSSPAAQGADPPQVIPPPLTNTITVNLNQILETGDMTNNIVLLPGDVVTVPHAGIVYVLGAVSRPGGYTVSNDRAQLTTLKVLSLAGGLNRTAKSQRAVIVRKDGTGKQHEVDVDLKKVMKFQEEDVQLRPSDILYVPNSAAKQTLVRVGELSLAFGSALLIYRLVY